MAHHSISIEIVQIEAILLHNSWHDDSNVAYKIWWNRVKDEIGGQFGIA